MRRNENNPLRLRPLGPDEMEKCAHQAEYAIFAAPRGFGRQIGSAEFVRFASKLQPAVRLEQRQQQQHHNCVLAAATRIEMMPLFRNSSQQEKTNENSSERTNKRKVGEQRSARLDCLAASLFGCSRERKYANENKGKRKQQQQHKLARMLMF